MRGGRRRRGREKEGGEKRRDEGEWGGKEGTRGGRREQEQ